MPTLGNSARGEKLQTWLRDRLPPNESNFTEIAQAYNAYPSRRGFLLTLAALDYQKLAETLLLFTDVLLDDDASEAEIRQAHQHYIINTDGLIPQREDEDAFDVFDWASQYAAAFNIALTRHRNKNGREETLMTIDDKDNPILCEEWGRIRGWSSAWSLRQVGHLINHSRYGRFDVIPSRLFPFEHDSKAYSKFTAIWMADLSNLVYRNEWYVREQLARWGFGSVRWIENKRSDTQAVVAVKDDCLVISFRGTKGAKDFLTDILFRKEPFRVGRGKSGSAGRVHRGFLGAFSSVWNKVLAAVDELGPDRPIFVTGHSLGAALAQLAALSLAAKGKRVAGVYLYGSPRAGDEDFVQAYNQLLESRTYLHINNTDIVTTVPPAWLGFRHVGQPARRFDEGHQLLTPDRGPDTQEAAPPVDMDAANRRLMDRAAEAIAASNAYLELKDLTATVQGVTYSADFETGRIDDHGIAQYLFKFACSIVDDKFEAMQD
jgi:pimeloyl-ACP methyl ester carboxylesterase